MWQNLLKFLLAPKFADEDQTRSALVLHVTLLTLFIVLSVLAFFTSHPVTVFVTVGMALSVFSLWLWMRRGYVQEVSWCLLGLLLVGITLIIYFNGTIRTPATSAFLACIVVAGLTLGNRATIVSSILISGILLALYLAEAYGKLPPVYYNAVGFLQWATYTGIICTTAVLLLLARNNILTALSLANRNAAEVANRNRELQIEIAERQQAEQALRESEERYRSLFELESDAIILVDAESKLILDANSAAVQLYGFTRQELLQLNVEELFTEAGWPSQHVAPGSPLFHIPQHLVRRKDGVFFPVEITGRYIDLQERQLFLVTARDITERVRSEEALRNQHEHLEELVQERTAQLTAINQELESFSYSVAHDLRAPLRAIDGFSRLLLEDYGDELDSDKQLCLDRIIGASDKMRQLIDALLSLSRVTRDEMKLERVNLSELARGILADLRHQNPERNVETIIADNLIVEADRRLMQVVLENLLGNAWKFTANQPVACIELGVQIGKTPVYFINDNGAGFNMAYADKLFGVFQRLHTDKEFPGTGIGLATVNRIIHRHNGEIWATGKVGRGATLYFTLPGN